MKNKKFLKPIKSFFGKHWQKWTIILILGIIIYIGFIFYQYIYKPIYQPRELVPQRLEIKEEIYQELMDFYSQQEEKINEILNKTYPNPFK